MRRYIAYFMLMLSTFLAGSASVLIWQGGRAASDISRPQTDSGLGPVPFDMPQVYIHRDIKWRPKPLPPPEIISDWKESDPGWDPSQWNELEAQDRLVVFYPSGDYAEVLVALWRINDTRPIDFAPNGESSYHVYKGKYLVNADGTVSTVASYSHWGAFNLRLRNAPDVYRRRWLVRRAAGNGPGALLEAEGEIFVPASELADPEQLFNVIGDWNQASQRP